MKIKHIYTIGVLLAVAMSAAACAKPADNAKLITTFRIDKKADALEGTLFATIENRERAVAAKADKAWIIEDGHALVWAARNGSGFEGEGQTLWRYDAASGNNRKLLVEHEYVAWLREVEGRSGCSALILEWNNGGIDYPVLTLVDPQRGKVWEQSGARLTGIRNGRLAIAVYRRSDIVNSDGEWRKSGRPIRMLYPDIDALRRRPVLKADKE